MNFSQLPDTAFLKVIHLLPFKERIRCGRVNKRFRLISQIAVSQTKSFDQGQGHQEKNLTCEKYPSLTSDTLWTLLNLCSQNLEKIQIAASVADTFARFSYPHLTELKIEFGLNLFNEMFDIVMENAPNLESLTLRVIDGHLQCEFSSSGVTHGNLKSLHIKHMTNGAVLRKLAGYFPNLIEFGVSCEREAFLNDEGEYFDEFLAQCPQLEIFNVDGHGFTNFIQVKSFWKLSSLRELDVCPGKWDTIVPRLGDNFLIKIASSFARLEVLCLDHLEVTNRGLDALVGLNGLRSIWLDDIWAEDSLDQSIRRIMVSKDSMLESVYIDSEILPATLVTIVNTCSKLSWLCVNEIEGIDSIEMAVQVARSFRDVNGTAHADLEIAFSGRGGRIWLSEAVKLVLKQLSGRVIVFSHRFH